MLFFEEDTSKKNTLLTPYSWILRHDWKNPIPGSRSKHTGVVQREATEMPHRLPRAIMEATCWEGTHWVGSQHGMAAAIGRGLVLRSGKTGFSVRPWHASFQDWFWLGWVLSISIYEISPYSRTRPLFAIPKTKTEGPSPLVHHTFSHATELDFGAHPELGTVGYWEAQSRFFSSSLKSSHTGFWAERGKVRVIPDQRLKSTANTCNYKGTNKCCPSVSMTICFRTPSDPRIQGCSAALCKMVQCLHIPSHTHYAISRLLVMCNTM